MAIEKHKKEWWYPEKVDDKYIARLRADYPERAHLSNEELLEYFEVNDNKYAVTWDHLGDAYPEYEELADAYFEVVAQLEELTNGK